MGGPIATSKEQTRLHSGGIRCPLWSAPNAERRVGSIRNQEARYLAHGLLTFSHPRVRRLRSWRVRPRPTDAVNLKHQDLQPCPVPSFPVLRSQPSISLLGAAA